MALAVTMRFDFQDEVGGRSFTKVRVPTGFAISDYIEFAQAYAQLLANLSTATVTTASITFAVDLSGLGLDTVAGLASDVAEKALFIFNTAVTGFRKRLRIPTFSELLITAGSDNVNTSDIDVAAFVSAMEDGIVVAGPATIQPSNDREHDVTSLLEARQSIRRTLT